MNTAEGARTFIAPPQAQPGQKYIREHHAVPGQRYPAVKHSGSGVLVGGQRGDVACIQPTASADSDQASTTGPHSKKRARKRKKFVPSQTIDDYVIRELDHGGHLAWMLECFDAVRYKTCSFLTVHERRQLVLERMRTHPTHVHPEPSGNLVHRFLRYVIEMDSRDAIGTALLDIAAKRTRHPPGQQLMLELAGWVPDVQQEPVLGPGDQQPEVMYESACSRHNEGQQPVLGPGNQQPETAPRLMLELGGTHAGGGQLRMLELGAQQPDRAPLSAGPRSQGA